MQLIPTYCDRCAQARLVDIGHVHEGLVVCPRCQGASRIVPGSSYRPEDVALFDEMATALGEAGVSATLAARLRAQLDSSPTVLAGERLQRLARALPSAAVLEVTAHRERNVVRKAEGMLTTLLDAIASTHTQSTSSSQTETGRTPPQ